VLWLGRIIPRKRLDLFLSGLKLAIEKGADISATIVGDVGFIRGYDQLIQNFEFPDRLNWIRKVQREDVPALMWQHDVLAQPSDEENFGSSVAEAQACGLPVIVGATNGNADYLCSHDIHLQNDDPQSFANALMQILQTDSVCPKESRQNAETCFATKTVVSRLVEILEDHSKQACVAATKSGRR
jgi:glycosyltransferase involved in cell wall biosynthesis